MENLIFGCIQQQFWIMTWAISQQLQNKLNTVSYANQCILQLCSATLQVCIMHHWKRPVVVWWIKAASANEAMASYHPSIHFVSSLSCSVSWRTGANPAHIGARGPLHPVCQSVTGLTHIQYTDTFTLSLDSREVSAETWWGNTDKVLLFLVWKPRRISADYPAISQFYS